MKRLYTILLLLTIRALSGFAQFNENPVSLPTSAVWNFMKYGNATANLYTGTAQVSIPVCTYKDNDFTIPVSLDYASTGLTVNRHSGIVGWDWSLTTGGHITREVKGDPDENVGGYIGLWKRMDLTEQAYDTSKFYSARQPGAKTTFNHRYFPDSNGVVISGMQGYETQPDVFHFNFMGYSGSFVLGHAGTIHVFNTNNRNDEFKVGINESLSEITITTGNGYVYLFKNGPLSSGSFGSDPQRTSWYLYTITTPAGRTALFNYMDGAVEERFSPKSFYHEHLIRSNASNLSMDHFFDDARMIEGVTQTGRHLWNIFIDNVKVIEFEHQNLAVREQFRRTLEFTRIEEHNPNLKVTGIKLLDTAGGKVARQATLTYSHAFTGNPLTFLERVTISGEGSYTMEYLGRNGNTAFPHSGTFNFDHYGYYNGPKPDAEIFLKGCWLNADNSETIPAGVREFDHSYATLGMLRQITYPTGGKTSFEYEPNQYGYEVERTNLDYNPSFRPMQANLITSGMRVKSIADYISGAICQKRTYTYQDSEGRSTGIRLYVPRYLYSVRCNFFNQPVEQLSMASIYDTYRYGPHIEYSQVTETRMDSSRIVYAYDSSEICPDQSQSPYSYIMRPGCNVTLTPGGSAMYTGALANMITPEFSTGQRGKLYEKTYYNAAGRKVRVERNEYDRMKTLRRARYYADIHFAIRPYNVCIDNYPLHASVVEECLENGTLLSAVARTYNDYGQVASEQRADSQGDVHTTTYQYVNDIPAGSRTAAQNKMIETNQVNEPLMEERYVVRNGETTRRKTGSKRHTGQIIGNRFYPYRVEALDVKTNLWYPVLTYNAFDDKGNPRQVTDAKGMPVSYLWSYNGSLLVAEIRNANFAQTQSAAASAGLNINALLTAGTVTPADTQKIDNLRAWLPQAHITTFSHRPSVGIASDTNPARQAIYYDYDDVGRPKEVYLNDGNKKRLLEFYDYNYINE